MTEPDPDAAGNEPPAVPSPLNHREDLLDEALEETFPASDPFEPPHVD